MGGEKQGWYQVLEDDGINVLSLFDGMSCGQIALKNCGIKVKNYFASEIKPHGIKVTNHNFPNTIQLGDVFDVKKENLPQIDLLIGGSPCQDFSRGNRERLGLEGGKSSLFYQFFRLHQELKPKYFLLENVVMDAYWYNKISEMLSTYPVRMCGSLVSAAYRDRLYWTNIGEYYNDLFGNRYCDITPPKDLKVTLQSILTSGYADRIKARCLLESDSRPLRNKEKMLHRYYKTGFSTIVFEDKNDKNSCRYLNQTELERCNNIPDGYTSLLNRNKAACLIGDGWNVGIIQHIFNLLKMSVNDV